MTLLIACFLIYNFHMSLWWYALAGAIWLARLFVNPSALRLLDL
jgi:hypothetical protein